MGNTCVRGDEKWRGGGGSRDVANHALTLPAFQKHQRLPSNPHQPPPSSNMPSHGRKKSKKTGVLGQALISDRFGRKGVFRCARTRLWQAIELDFRDIRPPLLPLTARVMVTCRKMQIRCVQRVTRHTSHVTRHTSHVTRHTSHVTRHTSHVTRHTLPSCLLPNT